MRIYTPSFVSSLMLARDEGIAPVYFLHVVGKNFTTGAQETLGIWSGDEDIAQTVEMPNGTNQSRNYYGNCGMMLEELQYTGDLSDTPVTIQISQIADAAQMLVRGIDIRLAYCELHGTSRRGGSFVSIPQLLWVGVIDEAPVTTPAVDGEGGIRISIRSELMTQLSAINPAKSSDSHQRRRQANDRFCEYASVVHTRHITWKK